MGKIMEAVFCVFYLIFTFVTSFVILKRSKNSKELALFGLMALVLVSGDSFHLVPRILVVINPTVDYTVALGIGKLVTSITMTVFYMILYYYYCLRYEYKNDKLNYCLIALAACRIILCLMPGNDWTGASPVIWGVYRNIPFSIMGIIMIVLFYNKRDDKAYKWMWLAILLSFGFYIPVVLWADVNKMIGMLMLPKTCMYIWMVVMGYKLTK